MEIVIFCESIVECAANTKEGLTLVLNIEFEDLVTLHEKLGKIIANPSLGWAKV